MSFYFCVNVGTQKDKYIIILIIIIDVLVHVVVYFLYVHVRNYIETYVGVAEST